MEDSVEPLPLRAIDPCGYAAREVLLDRSANKLQTFGGGSGPLVESFMVTLAAEEFLLRLPDRHQEALKWFAERAGTIQRWPQPLADGTLLATRAKGIYKPCWSVYALSVREVLDRPYPDRAPERHPDGSWTYCYCQENRNGYNPDDQYTNRGLMACMRDHVPVGVMRQISGRPSVQYEVLGIALVAEWKKEFFFLKGLRG